jgi:hypothetical protein
MILPYRRRIVLSLCVTGEVRPVVADHDDGVELLHEAGTVRVVFVEMEVGDVCLEVTIR